MMMRIIINSRRVKRSSRNSEKDLFNFSCYSKRRLTFGRININHLLWGTSSRGLNVNVVRCWRRYARVFKRECLPIASKTFFLKDSTRSRLIRLWFTDLLLKISQLFYRLSEPQEFFSSTNLKPTPTAAQIQFDVNASDDMKHPNWS